MLLEKQHVDEAPVPVHDRQVANRMGAHQRYRLLAPQPRPAENRRAVHGLGHRRVE
jgi:hypothetical protein